jgi:hypothetical protein
MRNEKSDVRLCLGASLSLLTSHFSFLPKEEWVGERSTVSEAIPEGVVEKVEERMPA